MIAVNIITIENKTLTEFVSVFNKLFFGFTGVVLLPVDFGLGGLLPQMPPEGLPVVPRPLTGRCLLFAIVIIVFS